VSRWRRPGRLLTLLAPRALLTVFLFSLASLAALRLTVSRVSARVNDVRSARQIGRSSSCRSAPEVAEFAGFVDLTAGTVIAISSVLVVLNAVLMGVAIRLFDRESILTRWK
jgi:hypothetical protein